MNPPPMTQTEYTEALRKALQTAGNAYAFPPRNAADLIAITNGENSLLRIALCGYTGEHVMPDLWQCVAWTCQKGYESKKQAVEDRSRERIWFSPHCLKPLSLFGGVS